MLKKALALFFFGCGFVCSGWAERVPVDVSISQFRYLDSDPDEDPMLLEAEARLDQEKGGEVPVYVLLDSEAQATVHRYLRREKRSEAIQRREAAAEIERSMVKEDGNTYLILEVTAPELQKAVDFRASVLAGKNNFYQLYSTWRGGPDLFRPIQMDLDERAKKMIHIRADFITGEMEYAISAGLSSYRLAPLVPEEDPNGGFVMSETKPERHVKFHYCDCEVLLDSIHPEESIPLDSMLPVLLHQKINGGVRYFPVTVRKSDRSKVVASFGSRQELNSLHYTFDRSALLWASPEGYRSIQARNQRDPARAYTEYLKLESLYAPLRAYTGPGRDGGPESHSLGDCVIDLIRTQPQTKEPTEN